MFRVLVPIILVGIMIATIIDIIVIDRSRVRHLPKGVWIVVVVLLPLIGTILWLGLGRGRFERYAGPTSGATPRREALGPDDDPSFLDNLQQRKVNREQEERIRDLERQLSELDDESDGGGPGEPKGGSAGGPAGAPGQ
jgi:hypothetical protein